MNRIVIEAPVSAAQELREQIEAKEFTLDPMRSVERNPKHTVSDEAFFEERYVHTDGNVVRFFPHTTHTAGPDTGEPVCILIEYKTEAPE